MRVYGWRLAALMWFGGRKMRSALWNGFTYLGMLFLHNYHGSYLYLIATIPHLKSICYPINRPARWAPRLSKRRGIRFCDGCRNYLTSIFYWSAYKLQRLLIRFWNITAGYFYQSYQATPVIKVAQPHHLGKNPCLSNARNVVQNKRSRRYSF